MHVMFIICSFSIAHGIAILATYNVKW